MQITVQGIAGCPYLALAQQRLREALREGTGTPVFVSIEQIVDEDHCRRIAFRGSPTILIAGRDPFDEGARDSPTWVSVNSMGPQDHPRSAQSE